uniref:Uncharacterized protein n=1 Tax=Anopheles christyi TaxID=43041 RepID=A0A182KGJ7_9DIPT
MGTNSLSSVQCEANNALQTLLLCRTNLDAVPPTVNVLSEAQRIEMTFSNLDTIDFMLFCNLSKLNTLSFVRNKIKHIANSATTNCSLYSGLKYLYISQNALVKINLEMFNPFDCIVHISFFFNQLHAVIGDFQNKACFSLEFGHNKLRSLELCRWNLPKLSLLHLSSNSFVTLPLCFDHIPSLKRLDMSNNLLSNISVQAFAKLDSLVSLDFSSNQITFIELNTPHYPKNLQLLKLRNNRLTSLDLSFVPVQLLEVNVQRNLISCFDANQTSPNSGLKMIEFGERNALTYLYVGESNLVNIPETIKLLKDLIKIEMIQCLIHAIDIEQFCDLALQLINFYANRIHHVVNSAASKNCILYESLQSLILSANLLKTINMELFNPFRNMLSVSISENGLEAVLGGLQTNASLGMGLAKNKLNAIDFCKWNVPHLIVLHLHHNKLTTVPSCLDKVHQLTELRLVSNQLVNVSIESFAVMDGLKTLDLSYNRLTSITLNSYRYPPNLEYLGLSDNNLTELDLSLVPVPSLEVDVKMNRIASIDFNSVSPNVTKLSMTANPIDYSWNFPGERINLKWIQNNVNNIVSAY